MSWDLTLVVLLENLQCLRPRDSQLQHGGSSKGKSPLSLYAGCSEAMMVALEAWMFLPCLHVLPAQDDLRGAPVGCCSLQLTSRLGISQAPLCSSLRPPNARSQTSPGSASAASATTLTASRMTPHPPGPEARRRSAHPTGASAGRTGQTTS